MKGRGRHPTFARLLEVSCHSRPPRLRHTAVYASLPRLAFGSIGQVPAAVVGKSAGPKKRDVFSGMYGGGVCSCVPSSSGVIKRNINCCCTPPVLVPVSSVRPAGGSSSPLACVFVPVVSLFPSPSPPLLLCRLKSCLRRMPNVPRTRRRRHSKAEQQQPLRPASADAVWTAGPAPARPFLRQQFGPFSQVSCLI